MADLADLIQFIRTNPLNELWTARDWENELSISVPNWRKVVKESANWGEIEATRPERKYDHLCKTLVECGGLELAKRWFYSEVSNQKEASKSWLYDHISMWHEFDREMKNEVLTHFFYRWPGEPFESMRDVRGRRAFRRPGDYFSFVALAGYVPSPQIEKLRLITEHAGDTEYLERIDEMIAQRERAGQVTVLQQQHRIPHSPNGNQRELIARLMEITSRSGYLPAALPPILISSETPPIFIAYPELEEEEDDNRRYERNEDQIPRNQERRRPETISIEELLGVYQPVPQQIIIYQRGIKWRRNRFNEEWQWLFAVVLIHEIGHWITHQLPQPRVPTWPTDLYVLGETDVHEGWAQLITWWIADQVGGKFKETFEALNKTQSPPYRVFEQFKTEPIDKVMASLEKLRLLQWPARLEDWKKVI